MSDQPDRYVIGRNGVFATLYDRQEQRLIVDNATEEHCRRVRDGLEATTTNRDAIRDRIADEAQGGHGK